MAELLLELLSEEIPARMQARASDDLKRLVGDGLKAAGLTFTDARAFATPRRLALVVDGIPERSEDQTIEKRGPRVGAPDQAIEGFLRGAGLTSLDQAEKRDTGRGEFWFAVQRVAGSDAIITVAGIVTDTIDEMPWPKSMRWGGHKRTWVRPLQSIIAQFDGKDIGVRFYSQRTAEAVAEDSYLLRSGNTTRGHRFLSKGEIKIAGFADYKAKLREAYVILDAAERIDAIRPPARRLAEAAGVFLPSMPDLEEEVTGLVEWPVPLIGKIDDEFMAIPWEVLVTSMRTHLRYFPTFVKGRTDVLANRFIVVANNVARDGGKVIIDGNERVLRARLSDAKFFWDLDRKTTLEGRLPRLAEVVFHAKLGTQAQRVDRIRAIASNLVGAFPHIDRVQLDQAARLCKADLTSGMVGEFPELQGTMGRYYAHHEGLATSIAEAIGDHYSPVGPSDRCPTAPISVVIALADKLDSLASFWAVGEKPTGSRDPFALRRSALGVIRLIVENKIRVDLREVLEKAFIFSLIHTNVAEQERVKHSSEHDVYRVPYAASAALMQLAADATQLGEIACGHQALGQNEVRSVNDLLVFFAERLKVQMREKGVRHDVVDAVVAIGNEDDLVRLLARVEAVQSFLGTEAGKNLLTAYGRAANIVRAEEKKDKGLGAKIAVAPDAALLEQAEEKAVATALGTVEQAVKPALAREDFAGAMTSFAGLRGPIDALFEKVTVNVADKPELRLNRLKLLNQIRATMDSVADFSKIEG